MKKIFINGRVFTGELPLQEAFAVEENRFAAVGTTDDMLALAQQTDEIIDLAGRFVTPGFNDSHMHLLNYGNAMSCCDLRDCTSMAELQQRIAGYIKTSGLAKEQWIRGRGWNQDYFADGGKIPDRYDLDQVTSEYPVCIVRCCGHCLSANSKAIELLGIDGTQPQPEGGHYDTDEMGNPTGVFRDNAMSMVLGKIPAPDKQEIKRMLRLASQQLSACGITSVQTDDLCTLAGVDYRQVIEAYRELIEAGEMTVRVYEQSQFTSAADLLEFMESGCRTGAGDDMFRIGPLKLMGDGSLGARTAYLSRAYADAPGEQGFPIYTQQQFDEMIGTAVRGGMQVAVHSIGDGALDMILSAYERAFAMHPRQDHRCGVVHVQITRPDQLEKMKRLGLIAYVQTIFIDYDAKIVYDRAGQTLAETSYAFSTMQKMGIPVSNGTDCPVELPDPMRGIQCAVTRSPLDGSCEYLKREAMTLEEALRTYTSAGAYASFEEDAKGRIAPGYLADFAVLSEDPFCVEADTLCRITAEETWLGGKRVYMKKTAQQTC